jgi:6-phosphogluconolactonase (cycloisomerase 2 family)
MSRCFLLLAAMFCLVSSVTSSTITAGSLTQPQVEGRSFVYSISNPAGPNSIVAYERNRITGELLFIGTHSTGGSGSGLVVDSQSPLIANPEGTLLFAANPGSNDISVMRVNEDGSLTLIGSPVPSRGVQPASLALHDDLLYVANKGDSNSNPNYSGFRVGGDGSLVPIKKQFRLSRNADPTHILFDSTGRSLVGLRLGSRGIDIFNVKSNGRLRLRGSIEDQAGPFAAAFNPLDRENLIVADVRLPGASSYFVNRSGSIRVLNSVSNSPERAACWIAVHSEGREVWVSNTGTNSVSLYTIESTGGVSLVSSHTTTPFGRTPFEVVLDRGNRFLYQLNIRNPASIHVMKVSGERREAGLEDVAAVPLPAGSVPCGLVVVER